ncbi:hypothetical protein M430DRAFT_16550 [Amorphotheca resinae ATCC 22711]|uniref:Uncharacterized protein n=1 Tax=Amorphotheca resinae ATCC 22711 TaxID=857342 RepID=A0A2T3BC01_AMORE|nr:hypothetical protein M430DRAFT_16550 [Amorphotheca resinae ATCC 22711]PSS25842.1 hypothetical protein M430DRAFT_16550 [Amorphotheca resinae ATCC 22711]
MDRFEKDFPAPVKGAVVRGGSQPPTTTTSAHAGARASSVPGSPPPGFQATFLAVVAAAVAPAIAPAPAPVPAIALPPLPQNATCAATALAAMAPQRPATLRPGRNPTNRNRASNLEAELSTPQVVATAKVALARGRFVLRSRDG